MRGEALSARGWAAGLGASLQRSFQLWGIAEIATNTLKGLTVLHTRGNVASVDPLGDVAVNSFGHHSRRHNTAMRRWEGFIRRTWRCQTRLDLRGYHQCLNSHKPKLADVELLGAHGGERSIF